MRIVRMSLAGALMLLALIGGPGTVVVGQDESAAPAGSVAPAELPTGPAAFEFTVERTDDGIFFVSTDPRFSGMYASRDDTRLEVLPGRYLRSDVKRVENDAGAWEGPSSGYFWDDGNTFSQQTWWVGRVMWLRPQVSLPRGAKVMGAPRCVLEATLPPHTPSRE
jgi:hypothetical protein